MKEFNLGETVRLKNLEGTLSAKHNMREGIVVEKINIGSDIAYSVSVVGAEVDVYKPYTKEVIGKSNVISGVFEDNLEPVTE